MTFAPKNRVTLDYIALRIVATPEWADIVTAQLGELPFDTFEETEDGFNAYIRAQDWNDDLEAEVRDMTQMFPFSYTATRIESQNWNAVWEANFEPVRIGDFVNIRAEHHPAVADVRFDLLVQPKMAFGTGHHETTHMVVSMMEKINFADQQVFDYGCGTGILAIVAAKLGAAHIDAVDIELPSYESTLENCHINNVTNISAFFGDINAVPLAQYGIILANINRNVIVASLDALHKRAKSNAIILFSGFLTEDEPILLAAFAPLGWQHQQTIQRGKWLAMRVAKAV